MKKTIHILIYYSLFIIHYSFAQSKTDSLLSLVKIDNADSQLSNLPTFQLSDTNKVNHLNALGWELMYNNPDTSIILGNQALALCDVMLSGVEASTINHQPSTINHFKSNSLGNLGAYYYLKADYPRALDYYLKALKVDEELKN